MIQLALVVAAGSLASGLVLAFLLRRAPTVGLQLVGLASIAVCVPLAAVLLSGWVMFHMGADRKILAVAAGSATAAVFAAFVLGTLIGLIVGILRLRRIPVIDWILIAYIEAFRCTPILVQLLWVYYVLPIVFGIGISSLGAILIGTLQNGLNTLNISNGWIYIVTGLVLLGAVTLDTFAVRLQARSGR